MGNKQRGQRARGTAKRVGKEANYIACLLANGPPPMHKTDVGVLGNYTSKEKYRHDVMEWWRSCHNCEPMPTESGLHRFYNRFRRWYQQMRYETRKANN